MTLQQALESGAHQLGMPLPSTTAQALLHFLALLMKWNARINLTSLRDPFELISRHFVDSLAAALHVPEKTSSLIDVGSGAGFPGLVIGIVRPDIPQVVLVEANHKKTAFLQSVRRELVLPNVTVRSERIERFLASREFTPFDVAVSRATWDLLEWLALARSLVHARGVILGMEGLALHSSLPAECTRISYALGDRTRAIIRCST